MIRSPHRRIARPAILLFIALLAAGTATAGAGPEPGAAEGAQETGQRSPESWHNLQTLIDTIDNTSRELGRQRSALHEAVDDRERARIYKEIDRLTLDLESLQTALEMLATDGADLSLFGVKEEAAFNWRSELESVFEPVLAELRRLTERPRKIERLRTDQAFYRERLGVAEDALLNVTRNREGAPTPELKQAFASIEQRWRQRRDDLDNRYNLINYELSEALSPSSRPERDPVEALRDLFTGRILNLVLAVVAAAAVFLVLRLLAGVYERRVMTRARRRGVFAARVGNLLFYLLTAVLVLLSAMAVLYVRGDWLLLGILIILLLGAGWALQKSLPNYLTEARLMLNLGPVREGERLIYEGLPWRVDTLSFYATLVNPLLQGGTLRIPVRRLVDHSSRVYDEREPWFPARVGDYVVLDDSSSGPVLTQSPEFVQMRVQGAVKTYGVADFLGQNPRNLTLQGFTVAVTFGLDYAHQAGVTGEIRAQLERTFREALARSELTTHMTSFMLDFKEAGASSLDFLAAASFTGEAAEKGSALQRLLQRIAVNACNEHGLVIPFNQITVHMAEK